MDIYEYDISTYDENLQDYVNGLWFEIKNLKNTVTRRNRQIKNLKKELKGLKQKIKDVLLFLR